MNKSSALSILCRCLLCTQSVRAAGGLLLFTQNGSPYVTAVQYETFSQPSAHLAYITTNGAKRSQIQTAGIVGQIPFPDANSPVSSADVESYVGMASMLAARYPQYAKIIRDMGEVWSRDAVKRRGEEEKAAKELLEQDRRSKIAEQQRLAQEEKARLERVAEETRRAKLENERLAQETEKQQGSSEEQKRIALEAEKQQAAIEEQKRIAKEAAEIRIAQVEKERRLQEEARQRQPQGNNDRENIHTNQSSVQTINPRTPEHWYTAAVGWLTWLGGEISGKTRNAETEGQDSQ